ncbi:Hint domain-containing protein [Paracoccus onubensis]|uniref:Hedgehog/Intein (Hint) domain-containing protein n=1 Tax=Paracoccus onubensis TaxID=1675788 RepID=A0A418SYC8_9RHOB|nr:Hint domain-containing protein [Paracoccus onubensis]RJE85947.1 hypothetical protein D3P04_09435 [Paracoccus onubensis]
MSVSADTSEILDDNTTSFSNIWALSTFSMNGANYIAAGSNSEQSVTIFRADDNGSLVDVGSAEAGTSVEAVSTITTSSGHTFVYAGGQGNGVGIFEVSPDGSLTNIGEFSSATGGDLTDIEALHSMTTNGNSYLVTTAIAGNGLSLWSVDPDTGELSEASTLEDTGDLELEDIRGMDIVATSDGEQYIVAAGGDDGIGSYRVTADGKIESVATIQDSSTLRLNDVDWVTSHTTSTGTYVYAGGQDSGISVFEVGNDGSLTNVQNWVGGTLNTSDGTKLSVGLGDLRSAATVMNDYLAVGSNGENMSYLFQIDDETGQIFLSAVAPTNDPEAMTAVGDQFIAGTPSGLEVITLSENGDFNFRNAVQDNEDPNTYNIQNTAVTHALEYNGEIYVIGSSRDGGISSFRVTDTNGDVPSTLTQEGIVTPNADSQPVEAIASVVTDSGKVFIYTAGQNDGVDIFQMDGSGNLASVGTQLSTSDNNIVDVEALTTLRSGESDYLVTSSVGGDALTLWEVEPETGALTQRDIVLDKDNSEFELEDVRGMDVATMADGTQYILAGGGDDGISVFKIDDGSKTLLNTGNINSGSGTDGISAINDIDWITTYTADSGTYVYAGGQGNGIAVFSLNTDGTLTLVQQVDSGTYSDSFGNDVSVTMSNTRAGDVNVETGQLLVGSSGQGAVYFFNINAETGAISFQHLTSVDGSTEGISSIAGTSVIAHGNILSLAEGVTCFTSGTLIETSDGNKPIEDLRPGDMIATMDDGYQPIRWIGSTSRDAIDLAQNPKLKPIRIAAGALGGGLPERDLTVSRQHRVLIRSKIAQRMFGAEEILIPAIKLVGLDGIEIIEDCEEVTYFHILFDKHQVIFSEDAPTESLFTGPIALQSVPAEARKEIVTLFPEITEPDFVAQSARPIPEQGKQIKQLVARHKKRGMPLLSR